MLSLGFIQTEKKGYNLSQIPKLRLNLTSFKLNLSVSKVTVIMGTSSGSHFNNHQSSMLPPRQTLISNLPERGSNSDQVRESQSENTSSRENGFSDHSMVRNMLSSDQISLKDIVSGRIEIIAEKMQNLPHEYLNNLKNAFLSTSQKRDEFLFLQQLVQSRTDLTERTLLLANRIQLEILLSLKTGINAFLHPSVNLSHASLIDVFLHKRCRNISCGSDLPAENCTCESCKNGTGFCNLCMCVICHKFDSEVNTCRWIGCDFCAHWTHTDCATRNGLIGPGPTFSNGSNSIEMLFRCRACGRASELFGWIKDVFLHCASTWNREDLVREFDYVCRIFHGSEDSRGRKLFWKCEEAIEKLKSGVAESMACKGILIFFQELDPDFSKNQEIEDPNRAISPHEAFNKIADVVHEAVKKMEVVADEKLRVIKKARLSIEACELELNEKTREIAALKMEKQAKKMQIDELESIIRLKQAESDMFEVKANEARREAERLQRIALAKTEKSEDDYMSRYLKQRLDEAEKEKQYLFEKMKVQESGSDHSDMVYSKIQDLLKNM